MSRRILQMAFGLLVGIGVRLFLPGHPGMSFAAEKLLPGETGRRAGFAVSAIGALAVLLVYGIAA